jgi:hypothetical protein
MIPDEIFLKIVRSAVKAPSGHNTQPWLFAKEEDGICIIPDYSRSLPVADPEHRELFISLGCAAETAMKAARFYGYRPSLQIVASNKDCSILIALQRDDNIVQPELFSFINSRQTTRNLFDNKSIPGQDLETMKTTVSDAGLNILFFTGQNEIQHFSHFIAEANVIQMGNPEFRNELIQWMRFSEKEAMQKGDGLYAACSGVPSMGRLLGSLVLKNFVTAKSENKRLLKQLKKSAAIVLLTSSSDNAEDLIKTGMAFQCFALTATKLGLSHSFINSPCQITRVREKMMNEMGLAGVPQLLIRLGYSPKMHFSFRRRINDVILK